MKRYGIVLLLIAGVVSTAVAVRYGPLRRQARADSASSLLDLAPADATLIAYADVETIRKSPLVRYLTSLAGPTNIDKDYADFIRATGFDYQRDLDRVVLASRRAPATQTLVFAQGRFDRTRIEQYALRSGKLQTENGRAIYLVPSGTTGKTISITFLADNRIALSDGGDITSALAPHAVADTDPAVLQGVSRVAGSPLFIVAKPTALAAANGATTVPQSSSIFALFAALHWVSIAAKPDGSTILVSAEGECGNPEEAQKIASSFEFLRGMLHGGLSDPKSRGRMPAETAAEADRLLQAVRVSTDAERVRLLLAVTPEMLPAAPGAQTVH